LRKTDNSHKKGILSKKEAAIKPESTSLKSISNKK
jgi:hypothetical protein